MLRTATATAIAIAAVAIAAVPASLQAHRLWMAPSTTIISSADGWVTFDAAASTDVFHADHQPMRVEPSAFAPDGSAAKVENFNTGRFRSTFDLHLTQPGTWKVAMQNDGIGGSYKLNGEEKRLPRGTTADKLPGIIPAGATDVALTQMESRYEVFVTSGAPTDTVLRPTGKGLEMVAETHPSDVVTGEDAVFGFIVDGKPAAGLEVLVVRGGKRYRDAVDEQTLKTDAAGKVRVSFSEAGMYWLNASATGKSATIPGAARRMSYTTTLEVLGA
ncbi:DUF4198 domain-containing protein [Sphingomonas sp. 37zxx]|uniref:DUF4198 domain-containing protein n=1 Tax=Sphingomonas sp. 37zxx TaxID=1550073 RepID=UPI00068E8EF0|nr:DUF4198 domain-containing protein [Sphingomonas sp. 37zxx]